MFADNPHSFWDSEREKRSNVLQSENSRNIRLYCSIRVIQDRYFPAFEKTIQQVETNCQAIQKYSIDSISVRSACIEVYKSISSLENASLDDRITLSIRDLIKQILRITSFIGEVNIVRKNGTFSNMIQQIESIIVAHYGETETNILRQSKPLEILED